MSDFEKIVRNIRICSGSTNDKFIWRHSDMREYMYSLRLNQQIVDNEGYYYMIGKKRHISISTLTNYQHQSGPYYIVIKIAYSNQH